MKQLLRRSVYAIAVLLSLALFQACKHDAIPGPATLKLWEAIPLHASYEIPAPAGRNEEGEATIQLLSDNSLKYTFHIHNLSPGDALTAAHIHTGNAGTSGDVLVNLSPTFIGSGATGMVTGLRSGQVDSLLSQPIYINVHSSQVSSGLARGQLDKKIGFAMDILMNGANEAPNTVSTTANGVAILRLTDDKVLYSKIMVNNLEANDTLTVAHIHRGALGVAGPIRVPLCGAESDFGVLKISAPLEDSIVNMIKNDPMYVNAHSRRHGAGIVRGQIR